MTPRTAAEIASIVGGRVVGDDGAVGLRAVTDSRTARVRGDVFFALAGDVRDGARFAPRALSEGASIAVLRRGAAVSPGPGQAVVEVADPLASLQALAAQERTQFTGVVVGVTGSNGKTTTKDMIVAALSPSLRVYGSPMSYNSQVGVALSLLELDPEAAVAVIECGISRPGEMERLQRMVRPDLGVFVNVGDAHLEGLGSRVVTAREKARLFAWLPADAVVFLPAAEALAAEATAAAGAAVARVDNVADTATLDAPFATDAALAMAVAERVGVARHAALAGLSAWRPAPMRMEITETPRGVTVINDAYVADPVSTELALSALARRRAAGRAVAVLGGMDQLGAAHDDAHARIGRHVVALGIDNLVGVGAGGQAIVSAAREAGMAASRAVAVASVDDAAELLEALVERGDTVLLKASRPDRLERIASVVFESVAPARMHVDLDQLVENLRQIRRHVGPDVGVMPVVKSFGYGLDARHTALALAAAGVEHFCVAYADEGVRLRELGIDTPILVQNVVPEDATKCALHGLSCALTSSAQVDVFSAAAAATQRAIRVHVKVDTGMGRAGAPPDEAVAIAQAAASDPWLSVDGAMTHFASADDPAADNATRAQIATFRGVLERLGAAGISPRWVHACNSHGIARFPEAHFNLVRPGLGLLGYAIVDGAPMVATRPVVRLTTRIVAVKQIPAGAPVGYGATWHASAPTTIALAAIGYGDGYPRALSNRGWMTVNGARCAVVGRVSMDVATLDVTAAPHVSPGDEVVVYGDGPDEPTLVDAAAAADTIAYELLARITSRVRRIYRRSHG